MKKYTSVAFLALLASPVANASENQVKDMSDQESKETCLKSVFGGKLENLTDSRSLWTMITRPQTAWFLRSPEDAYIQCLRKNPKARDLVTFKQERGWITIQTVSATIGDTIIEGLDKDGKKRSLYLRVEKQSIQNLFPLT